MGCPYIEEVNKILMAIFEAGIITKMTENEYEKLGKQKELSSEIAENVQAETAKDTRRKTKAEEESNKLKPISLKMLQGSFYLLCFGNAFSGMILAAELMFHKNQTFKSKKNNLTRRSKWKKYIKCKINQMRFSLRRLYRNIMHEAFISTLEYIE
ncbi:hypothetical protein JTB14_005360 [Gonioctena quinquepunctata]|nr:hypothetical protein JTB14_005360 [Gonioctena quinquepunctata]